MWVSAAHLASKNNLEADQQSIILQGATESKPHPQVFQKIADKFGNPDIDLFAPRIDRQLKRYVLGIQNQRLWQLMPSLLLGITTFFIYYHLLVF